MTEPFGQYGPTIRVEGGIRAQSTRGAIGESWWSKRFLAVLESFALGSRLTRGRNYARKGQVLSLDVTAGKVTSTVQGSRPRPYEVHIGLPVLTKAAWSTVEATLADQALFSARLLAGEMPQQIERVFDEAGASLFPTGVHQLTMRCSCPDSQVPCKHLAATFYLLAESFDADPFQILHWRGRDRQTLLAHLRTRRAAALGAEAETDSDTDGSGPASSVKSTGKGKGRKPNAGPTADADAKPRAGRGAKATAGSKAGARTTADLLNAADPAAASSSVVGASTALAELDSPDLADTVDRFWVAPVPLSARPPTLDTKADLLLRQLAAPDATLGGAELLARLRTLYASLS